MRLLVINYKRFVKYVIINNYKLTPYAIQVIRHSYQDSLVKQRKLRVGKIKFVWEREDFGSGIIYHYTVIDTTSTYLTPPQKKELTFEELLGPILWFVWKCFVLYSVYLIISTFITSFLLTIFVSPCDVQVQRFGVLQLLSLLSTHKLSTPPATLGRPPLFPEELLDLL